MAESYEVEIKSLLGTKEAAEKLRSDLKKIDPSCVEKSSYTQLNHYFEGGDPVKLAERLAPKVSEEAHVKMEKIAHGSNISVRTRAMNGETRIVMKASVGDDSSANGVARLEIEEPVKGLTLDELDQEVLAAGFKYQAKWSRTREEYALKDMSVCLDKNAGYGYLAEFERVVDDQAKIPAAKESLYALMKQVGAVELPQDRLERMFAYYNLHWPEYYGTENIFTIQ